MKINCIIAVDEDGMAIVIKKSAQVKIEFRYLISPSAGIYQASVDGVGNWTIEKQLMISSRGC